VSALERTLADYLQLRRSLGHDLADAARLLPSLVGYLDAHGSSTVTVAAAFDWAQQACAGHGSTTGPRRMTAVRGFARYLSGIDPATEIPPVGLMPYRQRWPHPFVYSPNDIDSILDRVRGFSSPLRAATYCTVIGLLAATGLRVGEAIKLDRNDVDWSDGVLLIRESKFGKSRLVPLQTSSMKALTDYARLREQLQPHAEDPAFFTSLTRKRLLYAVVGETFRRVVDDAGIGADAPHRPRLHDLRHTFAVRTLLGWYRSGEDVQSKIPSLSTYLGHREPASTYWYLSAVPELLAMAAARQESAWSAVTS
jgi:integrase/recombinase XerD